MTEYTVKNNTETSFAGSNAGKVLTTTLWNQSGNIYVSINGTQTNLGVDYNEYCPVGYESGTTRTLTGCTNTADASVIYYWIEQGYAFDFNATINDYYHLTGSSGEYYLSNTSPGSNDTLSVSELNNLLNDDELMQTIAAAYDRDSSAIADLTASKTDLGNFIAALNFFCGVKNHSFYGVDATGTSWWYDNDNPDNHLIYKALGFDSYRHITVDCGNTDYDTPLMYDAKTNEFTEVGHSILQENLDYGEVIRVGIPEHDIYMDGYKIENGITYYHLNYGWGKSYATAWYSESDLKNGGAPLMDSTYGIEYVVIDLSPDINVVVSNDRSDYYGGSFERGIERVNNIQTQRTGEDAVDFTFSNDIAGKKIVVDETAEVLSWSDVNFDNIVVDLYSELATVFSSSTDRDFRSGGMNFDFVSGSLIVNNDVEDIYAINLTNNEKLSVTLNDSFIYGGYSSGGYDAINSTLDITGGYYYNNLSYFAVTVKGSVLNAGSADDEVVLVNNSALLGDIALGGGSNTLSVESGSLFYGGFSGSALTVNLTINSSETGAMLVMTSTGEAAFLAATNNTLNLNVDSSKVSEGSAYVLYSGDMLTQVKFNFSVDNGEALLLSYNNTETGNPDYTLVYDTANNQIKLAYAAKPVVISNIEVKPVKPLDEDGLTAGNVIVTADFSSNATEKYYSIDEGKTWIVYPDSGAVIENNASVIFKGVNSAMAETTSEPVTVDCIDKTPPPDLVITPSTYSWTNDKVVISAGFPANVEIPADFTKIMYSVDGGLNWIDYDKNSTIIEFTANGTVYFRAYDKRDNYSQASYKVTNIDKEKPVFPADAIIGSGTDKAQTVHVAINNEAVTDNSNSTLTYYYSTDGSTWNEYTDSTKFGENITVYFKVKDEAGNESDVVSYEIKNVDNVGPDKPVAIADITDKTNGNVTVTATFDLTCGDVAKVQWSTNGIDWNDCGAVNPQESTFVFVKTVESNTDLYFRSVDDVGNASIVEHYIVSNIDKTPPAVPVAVLSTDKLTNQPVIMDVQFDIASGDVVKNQYSYTGEDDDWHDYTGSLVFNENGKVYLRSVDDVGNTSYGEYEVTNIDRTAPAAPEIFSDNDGRLTDKPVSVGSQFAPRTVKNIEYSVDGENWLAFDPEQAIVAGEGEEAITEVTLRAYDLAGNVSAEETVALDAKGLTAELPDWSWSNEDAVKLQYSYDNYSWHDYTGEIKFTKNDEIYFRAVDEAGNISGVVHHKVGSIDDVADDRTMTKIFIDSSYTKENTYGKRIDGILLKYGENAFKSIAEAKGAYDFTDPAVSSSLHVVAGKLSEEEGDFENLDNIKLLSAIQVTPEGSYTGTVYSYKSKGVAAKTISLNGKALDQLSLEWFKNVFLINTRLNDIDGGNAEVKTSQRYSNGGKTLTRHTSHTNSASGFFKAEDNAVVQDVSGYQTVEITDSRVGALIGGKKKSSEDYKNTDNGKKYTESVKESSSATGSVELEKVTGYGNIENYKNVNLQWATVNGLIKNNKVDFSKSENYSETAKKFTRTITVKQTLSSDGSLKVNHSTINGNIQGYDKVILNSSQVGNVSRLAEDGGSYRKQNDSWKISKDAETGKITGKLVESMTYTNGGTFSISGETASAQMVENFSKVAVGGGAAVGNISNNVLLKDFKSYLYIWDDSALYGTQTVYTVNTANARVTILESVEKHAANGNLTVSDKSQTGNISGFNKVVISGKGTVGSITAVSLNNGGIICGTYEVKYKDTSKNKEDLAASGSITTVVTTKSAASVKVEGYTVNGDISGYKSVTVVDGTVNGDIDLGDAYTAKDVISYSTRKGIVTKNYSETVTYTNSGSLKLTETVVNGGIYGYSKVVMDEASTDGSDIVNNTAVKSEIKYNESWDSLEWLRDPEGVMSLEEFMAQAPEQNGLLFKRLDHSAANGSVTMKNNSVAGNISGYKTVKLEGNAHDDKKAALTVGSIKALITGNDTVCGSFKREENIKYADSEGKNYTRTLTVTAAPANSVTVFGYDVNGDISGYKNVKLTDTNVAGVIERGSDSKEKSVTVYTTVNGKVSKTVDTVITYKQNGSFSATDTVAAVGGNPAAVKGYNTVVLVNSTVGDIWQSDVIKEVKREIFDGNNQTLNDIVPTRKLTGSVKLSDGSVAGNITNYKTVTLENSEVGNLINVNKFTVSGMWNSAGGFTGTDGNDNVTVNKNSVLRISGAMDFGKGDKDKITVKGTLVWENNAAINGLEAVAGSGTIAAGSALFKDINNAFINSFEGTLLDLGNTSTGFRGVEFETADDDQATAFEWDGASAYEGWLGAGDDIDFTDSVDYIKVTAKEHSTLIISSEEWGSGTNDKIWIDDKPMTVSAAGTVEYELKAGGNYLIKIAREDDNSMSYTMSIA